MMVLASAAIRVSPLPEARLGVLYKGRPFRSSNLRILSDLVERREEFLEVVLPHDPQPLLRFYEDDSGALTDALLPAEREREGYLPLG